MISFIVDENHLRQLSPGARSELLKVLGEEVAELRAEFAHQEWDPEGNTSYPLNEEEARILIRGLGGPAKALLRSFCLNFDGNVGSCELKEMLRVTGHKSYEDLGNEISHITQRMHAATDNTDAWLFNWHTSDWEWSEDQVTYLRGRYYISNPAILSLRAAFSIGNS
jgi:hypothetical protein